MPNCLPSRSAVYRRRASSAHGPRGTLYDDPGGHYFTTPHPERTKSRALHQLQDMGYTVTLNRAG